MGYDGDINQLITMGHHLSRGEVMVDPQESIGDRYPLIARHLENH